MASSVVGSHVNFDTQVAKQLTRDLAGAHWNCALHSGQALVHSVDVLSRSPSDEPSFSP